MQHETYQNDILPGGNGNDHILHDGKIIELNDASNGLLAIQGNAHVVKLASGQLAYRTSNKVVNEVIYNTMSTPQGGQYQLTLSDGTRSG